MRKLASIQTIWEVQPIEGADRIEVVSAPKSWITELVGNSDRLR